MMKGFQANILELDSQIGIEKESILTKKERSKNWSKEPKILFGIYTRIMK